MDDLVVSFKLWGNKTSSVDFQIYLVNLKEDTITGLEFDIEIERTNYSMSLMRWVSLFLWSNTYSAQRRVGLIIHSEK